ncbi:MAG: hypothetical protein KGJ06_05045 [Pseudomonadota bacterium]|nr:hypothetical protein [Pseudomonadota bacterium]
MSKRAPYLIHLGMAVALAGCAASGGSPAPSAGDGKDENYEAVKAAAKETAVAVGAEVKEAAGHAGNLADAAKEGIYGVTDHLANWIRPEKPKPPLPVRASYCYRAYQDILCYRQPMPGWEFRLVAYQGTDAKPPPPAMMQLLPTRTADVKENPANRVAAAKPVFNEPPTASEDKKQPDADAASPSGGTEATHEQLPDPAMAPQL